ncbi:hypothetical protein BC939DRAFT_2003 [Gamsiella multidivaricata]|uniref:uncharacterized protein n=1 Tax=Gamsiella multidivaricata TaxID=101098 RepID=UPI00221EA15E|nr:uncharacterized protein BC939DRAFT_2003 [Gamsiella multidivaricata]KAI7832610.1 hypothetical protein BC939DRAFT_2003 [Gamsiella multidivaricata]
MAPFHQNLPQSPSIASRSDTPLTFPLPRSVPVPVFTNTPYAPDTKNVSPGHGLLTDQSSSPLLPRLHAHKQEQKQGQEQNQEQTQKQGQGQGLGSPSPPSAIPPNQPTLRQNYEPMPSIQFQQLQYACRSRSLDEQQYLFYQGQSQQIQLQSFVQAREYSSSSLKYTDRKRILLHTLSSPDPGYLDALSGYFSPHIGQPATIESQSGNISHAEDEEDDVEIEEEDDEEIEEEGWSGRANCSMSRSVVRDVQRRERRCSRLMGGPAAWAGTPLNTQWTPKNSLLVSPANDGTITTPPPSARVPFMPRRRRHSCVAPNTKEFRALATIFGWVTVSSSNSWLKGSDGQKLQAAEFMIEGTLQRCTGIHPASCESDNGLDMGEAFRPRSMMASCAPRESRGPELTDSCVRISEQGSRFSNGGVGCPRKSDKGLKSTPTQRCLTALPGQQPTPLQPSVEDEAIAHSQALMNESGDIVPTISELKGAQESTEQSTVPVNAPVGRAGFETQFDTGGTRCRKKLPALPLAVDYEVNSGYMPFSWELYSQSLQTSSATNVEPNPAYSQDNHCNHGIPYPPINQTHYCSTDAGIQRQSLGGTLPSSAPESPLLSDAPPVPPRYPEIDSRVFDHPEDEGPDSIVYAPSDSTGDISAPGRGEPLPIIAATIVKLIEKLTHQHGMGT